MLANPAVDAAINFGQTENTGSEAYASDTASFAALMISERSMENDVQAGSDWHEAAGLFSGWQQKVTGALAVAYPVYLHLLHAPDPTLAALKHLSPFDSRDRGPSKTNFALVAVQLVAKPKDIDQTKACSEYASMLIWAARHRVDPADFIERAANVTLRECKAEERERRREASRAKPRVRVGEKLAAPQAFSSAKGVAVVLHGGTDEPLVLDVPLDAAALQHVLKGLRKRTEPFSSALHLLGGVRNLLQSAPPVTQSSSSSDV